MIFSESVLQFFRRNGKASRQFHMKGKLSLCERHGHKDEIRKCKRHSARQSSETGTETCRRKTHLYSYRRGSESLGRSSGYKKMLNERNKIIINKFSKGTSVENLAEMFYLTPETIKKSYIQKRREIKWNLKMYLNFSLILYPNFMKNIGPRVE